jgi:hypothetical protein
VLKRSCSTAGARNVPHRDIEMPHSPPASQRVARIPELLSLIFSYLDHSQVGLHDHEHEDLEVAVFPSYCACSCDQCSPEDDLFKSGLGYASFPSPFHIPLVQDDNRGKKRTKRDEDEGRKNAIGCHCGLQTQPLSNLFNTKPLRLTAPTGPNRPSYNLANALVCRLWSPIALDVLWRVVDRPEHLFALLDGGWGSKRPPSSLSGLRSSGQGPGRIPESWKPGVKTFLGLLDDDASDDEDEDSDQDTDSDDDGHRVRRRQYELFVRSNFLSNHPSTDIFSVVPCTTHPRVLGTI